MNLKGAITIGSLVQIIGLISSITVPVLYIGNINTKIEVIGSQVKSIDKRLQKTEDYSEYSRRLIEETAVKNGVNISQVKQEISQR